MSAEAARSILDLHFSDAQNARIRELADRNNRGILTDEEFEAKKKQILGI